MRLENHEDRAFCLAGKLPEKKVRFREIEAVVDTGAVLNLMPRELVESLGLRIAGKLIVQLANDQKIELEQTEAIGLTVAGRRMVTNCLVGPPGGTPLLGQIVLEQLDLIVNPAKRTVTVRPESPFLPTLCSRPRRSAGKMSRLERHLQTRGVQQPQECLELGIALARERLCSPRPRQRDLFAILESPCALAT